MLLSFFLQAKPYGWLPGTGMSIEISITGFEEVSIVCGCCFRYSSYLCRSLFQDHLEMSRGMYTSR